MEYRAICNRHNYKNCRRKSSDLGQLKFSQDTNEQILKEKDIDELELIKIFNSVFQKIPLRKKNITKWQTTFAKHISYNVLYPECIKNSYKFIMR